MMSPLNNLEQKGGWALAFKTSEFSVQVNEPETCLYILGPK